MYFLDLIRPLKPANKKILKKKLKIKLKQQTFQDISPNSKMSERLKDSDPHLMARQREDNSKIAIRNIFYILSHQQTAVE